MHMAWAMSSAFQTEAQMSNQRPIPARNEPFCEGVRFTGSPPLSRFPTPAETDGMRFESASGSRVRMLACEPPGERPQQLVVLRRSEAVWLGPLVWRDGCR